MAMLEGPRHGSSSSNAVDISSENLSKEASARGSATLRPATVALGTITAVILAVCGCSVLFTTGHFPEFFKVPDGRRLHAHRLPMAPPAFNNSPPLPGSFEELRATSDLIERARLELDHQRAKRPSPRRKLFIESIFGPSCGDDMNGYVPAQREHDLPRAAEMCRGCLNQGCQWCPLTQTCVSSSRRCNMRALGKIQDSPVKIPEQCDTKAATWPSFMKRAYGDDWESKEAQLRDVIRCSQWAFGWKIDADPFFAKKLAQKEINIDVVGYWACQSAIMRAAMLRYLTGSHPWVEESETTHVEIPTDWDTTTVSPKICQIIRLHPDYSKSTTCEVDLYGVEEFAELRKPEYQPNAKGVEEGFTDPTEALITSLEDGPVVPFSPGAGKSGSGFAHTDDNQFKIKRGVKDGLRMDEPSNLLALVKGQGLQPLKDHLRKNPNSLLNRYYGLLRTDLNGYDSITLIMQDASYLQDGRISAIREEDSALEYTRYDLKGKSRYQKKKQDKDKQFCLYNGDFIEKEQNKLYLSSRQCWQLRKAVRADSLYLQKHNMIDYSIFLGVAQQTGGGVPRCEGTPGEPFCFEAGERQYTISTIDYLNDLNGWKKAEVPFGRFDNYDKKMIEFTEEICKSDESYEENRGRLYILYFGGGGGLAVIFLVIAFFVVKRTPPKRQWVPVQGSYRQEQAGVSMRTPQGSGVAYSRTTTYSQQPPQQHGPSNQMALHHPSWQSGQPERALSTPMSQGQGRPQQAQRATMAISATSALSVGSAAYPAGSAYQGAPRPWGQY